MNNGWTSLLRSHVLSHEMGHVLFLWHTHHGTVHETGDPYQCAECVDGSNTSTCGDYVADTPADPNIQLNVNISNCQWLGSGTDNCNPPRVYNPDTNNIMSYTNPLCMSYITPGQAARAKQALVLLSHLQSVSRYTINGQNPCLIDVLLLTIYPNPADDTVYLDLRDNPSGTYQYNIYNHYGESLESGSASNEVIQLNISHFVPNIYFVHVSNENVTTVKHLIVQ